jgi:hypothetical protein
MCRLRVGSRVPPVEVPSGQPDGDDTHERDPTAEPVWRLSIELSVEYTRQWRFGDLGRRAPDAPGPADALRPTIGRRDTPKRWYSPTPSASSPCRRICSRSGSAWKGGDWTRRRRASGYRSGSSRSSATSSALSGSSSGEAGGERHRLRRRPHRVTIGLALGESPLPVDVLAVAFIRARFRLVLASGCAGRCAGACPPCPRPGRAADKRPRYGLASAVRLTNMKPNRLLVLVGLCLPGGGAADAVRSDSWRLTVGRRNGKGDIS